MNAYLIKPDFNLIKSAWCVIAESAEQAFEFVPTAYRVSPVRGRKWEIQEMAHGAKQVKIFLRRVKSNYNLTSIPDGKNPGLILELKEMSK